MVASLLTSLTKLVACCTSDGESNLRKTVCTQASKLHLRFVKFSSSASLSPLPQVSLQYRWMTALLLSGEPAKVRLEQRTLVVSKLRCYHLETLCKFVHCFRGIPNKVRPWFSWQPINEFVRFVLICSLWGLRSAYNSTCGLHSSVGPYAPIFSHFLLPNSTQS